jgi:hypothetical protein
MVLNYKILNDKSRCKTGQDLQKIAQTAWKNQGALLYTP